MSDQVFGHEVWDFFGVILSLMLHFIDKHTDKFGSNLTYRALYKLADQMEIIGPRLRHWATVQERKGRQAS